jgi:hypothetical protein
MEHIISLFTPDSVGPECLCEIEAVLFRWMLGSVVLQNLQALSGATAMYADLGGVHGAHLCTQYAAFIRALAYARWRNHCAGGQVSIYSEYGRVPSGM